MAKYKFTKIEDEPFSDPTINKNNQGKNQGPFSQRGLSYKENGNHNPHDFAGMTEEQLDALRYIINNKGITLEDIRKSNTFKSAMPEEKTGIAKEMFVALESSRVKKYYYSKALYDAFPQEDIHMNSTFEFGVFLLMDNTLNYPIDEFKTESNSDRRQIFNLLKNIYIELKGIVDDTKYIINAKNNANVIKHEGSIKNNQYTNMFYDPKIEISYFNKINELPELTKKFNLKIIKILARHYNNLSEIITSMKNNNQGFIGLTYDQNLSFIFALKDYIKNYPTSLPEEWKKIIRNYYLKEIKKR